MPTYQYACTACAERLEVVQRFTDDPLTDCPECGGVLRKVFSPVGVVFKGSGFYKTDSRSKTSSSSSSSTPAAASAGSESAPASGSGSGAGAPAPADTPTAAPSTPPSTGSAAAAAG